MKTAPVILLAGLFLMGGLAWAHMGTDTHDGMTPQHGAAHDTKTADTLRTDGEITFFGRIELFDLFVIHDGSDHHGCLIGGQRRIGRFVNLPIDLDRGRKSCRKEQVRAVFLDHFLQQIFC